MLRRNNESTAENFHENNYKSQTRDIENNQSFSFSDGNTFSSVTIVHEDLDKFQYEFMKSFLYAVYQSKISYADFRVNKFITFANYYTPTALPVYVSEVINGMSIIENSVIFASASFLNNNYYVTVYSYNSDIHDKVFWKISISGENGAAQNAHPLFDFILNEAISNSVYKNKFLKPIKDNDRDSESIFQYKVQFADIGNVNLNDIYLTKQVKEELNRFIYCINNFSNLNMPLRYLLSGIPGTGKTKIIKAIANQCKGKATFLFSHGGDNRINMLFKFASLFNPCVICIDDIDFLVESRESLRSSSLSDFLQHMDGFVSKNLFVLATTNDKMLVDYAAGRPGRFDMILDINNISKENYMDLIKQSCSDDNILEIFSEEIISLLHSKHVTGSFIVNLVKQIKIKLDMQKNNQLEYPIDIQALISNAHKGFYQTAKCETVGFGFDGN